MPDSRLVFLAIRDEVLDHICTLNQSSETNGEWQRFNPALYLAELEVRGNMPVALDKMAKITWQKLAHLCLWEAVRQEVNYSKTKT